jgi:hypothetical protein
MKNSVWQFLKERNAQHARLGTADDPATLCVWHQFEMPMDAASSVFMTADNVSLFPDNNIFGSEFVDLVRQIRTHQGLIILSEVADELRQYIERPARTELDAEVIRLVTPIEHLPGFNPSAFGPLLPAANYYLTFLLTRALLLDMWATQS